MVSNTSQVRDLYFLCFSKTKQLLQDLKHRNFTAEGAINYFEHSEFIEGHKKYVKICLILIRKKHSSST